MRIFIQIILGNSRKNYFPFLHFSFYKAAIEDPNFLDYCKEEHSELKHGDFDNDGRSDLVCRVNEGEKYQIALTGKFIIQIKHRS